jgi:signal transduction histidine kinase
MALAMWMTLSVWGVAVLQGMLLLILSWYAYRFRRELPWTLVLAVYFGVQEVRLLTRLLEVHPAPPQGSIPMMIPWWDLALSMLAVVVLGLLVVTSARMLTAINALTDAASYRQQEYARALRHYNQLVRHRVFNPLTVIRGAATTLRTVQTDEKTREELLDVMVEAADVIRNTTLEPEMQSVEEESLDAIPRIAEVTVLRPMGTVSNNVRVENKKTSPPPPDRGGPRRLVRVLD